MTDFIKRLRDEWRLIAYDYRAKVLFILRNLILILSTGALGLLIFYHGFPHDQAEQDLLELLLIIVFNIFLLYYIIRMLLATHILQFIKVNWFEGILVFFILLETVSSLAGVDLLKTILLQSGITNYKPVYVFFTQLYVLILAGLEVVKASTSLFYFKVKPSILLLLAFAIVIILGAVTLMMPEMTTPGNKISFVDALFTSVSAVCVTGLIVVDTATFFSFKGQVVILILIQFGGIGIVTFASFFALFLQGGVGIKHQQAVQDLTNAENFRSTVGLLKQIILFTLTIEAIGAVMLFFLWDQSQEFFLNQDLGAKVFFSIFHSISAFCNAGFSTFTEGLAQPFLIDESLFQLVIATLIVVGGLGFPALRDLLHPANLRERMRLPWKKWRTGTTVAVYTSLGLITAGTILFFVLENDNVLEGLPLHQKVVHSIFQSVTTRTAGFNTVDISAMALPTVLFFWAFMFIGGSSGSTAGGIKTSTFVIVMKSVLSNIRGKRITAINKKSIPLDLQYKAFSVLVFAIIVVFISIFILSITEPHLDMMNIIFESISAFATVGLSRGVTPELSEIGKLVIIAEMYIGRVGILTLVFALSSRVKTTAYSYPETHMMIG